MTNGVRDRLALLVATVMITLSVVAIALGQVDGGITLTREGDRLVVASVRPGSDAAASGIGPGLVVVVLDGRVLLPNAADSSGDERLPTVGELDRMAWDGPRDFIQTIDPEQLTYPTSEWSMQWASVANASRLEYAIFPFVLGMAILVIGVVWLTGSGSTASLAPAAIPIAVGAAMPLLALPLERTGYPISLTALSVLLPLGLLPLAHALSGRVADAGGRRRAWRASIGAAVLAMLATIGTTTIEGALNGASELARWASLTAICLIPGIAAAAPSLLRSSQAGPRPSRLVESTESAVVGTTPGVAALSLLAGPYDPATVPMLLWIAAILLAGRFTVRPLLRVAQRATMHRDLVIAAAEAERTRLAADLHDDALQELTLLVRRLDAAGDHEGASLARGVADRLRAICGDLRLPILDDLGAGPALEWLVERVSRVAGHPIVLERDDQVRASPDVELTVFRVAQEALSNAVRHGRPPVVVRYRSTPSGVALTVDDGGPGIEPRAAERAPREGHFGLLNMAQRAEQIGAILDVRRWPAGGTHVALEWRPSRPPIGSPAGASAEPGASTVPPTATGMATGGAPLPTADGATGPAGT